MKIKKKKLFNNNQYRDEIYIEDADGNELLYWKNDWRNNRWGNDNSSESEYNKMMKLHSEYNFLDYDNCPNFIHYVIERNIYGNEKRIETRTLVEEYFNT